MSSTVPIVRQAAWPSAIPQLIIMGLLILLWYGLAIGNPVVNGALTYLVISFCLRTFIPGDHRRGMKLVKQEKYQEAIPYFEKSYDFFKKHHWLDKYRYITLLSSSKMTYSEMALVNIAFCYGQIGDGINSKAFYERTLKEFPHNGMAKAALNMLNSRGKAS